MTSPKFKLRNYRFFWVSTLMWYNSYNSTLKPLYKQIFAPKGFFVLRYRTLKFPGFCVTWHLAEGQESSYVGWKHYRSWEILPSKHSLSQNKYYFNLYEFLRWRIHALVGNSKTDVSVGFRRPYLCHKKHGVSVQSFIHLGKTFFWISRIWNIAQTWFLARLFV